jgi:hypothetical protein
LAAVGRVPATSPKVAGSFAFNAVRTTYVVLACAHLDHDPSNNALANLAAEHRCQPWWNVFRHRAVRASTTTQD